MKKSTGKGEMIMIALLVNDFLKKCVEVATDAKVQGNER